MTGVGNGRSVEILLVEALRYRASKPAWSARPGQIR